MHIYITHIYLRSHFGSRLQIWHLHRALDRAPHWALCLLVGCQTWPGQVAALLCSYLQPKHTFLDQLLWWPQGYSRLWLLLPVRLGHPCLIYHTSCLGLWLLVGFWTTFRPSQLHLWSGFLLHPPSRSRHPPLTQSCQLVRESGRSSRT